MQNQNTLLGRFCAVLALVAMVMMGSAHAALPTWATDITDGISDGLTLTNSIIVGLIGIAIAFMIFKIGRRGASKA